MDSMLCYTCRTTQHCTCALSTQSDNASSRMLGGWAPCCIRVTAVDISAGCCRLPLLSGWDQGGPLASLPRQGAAGSMPAAQITHKCPVRCQMSSPLYSRLLLAAAAVAHWPHSTHRTRVRLTWLPVHLTSAADTADLVQGHLPHQLPAHTRQGLLQLKRPLPGQRLLLQPSSGNRIRSKVASLSKD